MTEIMQKLLPPHLQTATYISKDRALTAWKDALPANTPLPNNTKHQKSWDLPIIHLHLDSLLTRCVDQTYRSCIIGASSRESGAWVNACTPNLLLGPPYVRQCSSHSHWPEGWSPHLPTTPL